MLESCRIIRDALAKMPKSGSVRTKLKPNPKGIIGHAYRRVESGRGSLGCHIVSDGKVEPYRVKLSVGSFRNLICIPYLLKGEKLGNMPVSMTTPRHESINGISKETIWCSARIPR